MLECCLKGLVGLGFVPHDRLDADHELVGGVLERLRVILHHVLDARLHIVWVLHGVVHVILLSGVEIQSQFWDG